MYAVHTSCTKSVPQGQGPLVVTHVTFTVSSWHTHRRQCLPRNRPWDHVVAESDMTKRLRNSKQQEVISQKP